MQTLPIQLRLIASLVSGIMVALPAARAAEQIQNQWLEATWQSATGKFQVRARDGARPFFTSQEVLPGARQAAVVAVEHEHYGMGRALAFTSPAGERGQVALYDLLPFAVFDRQLQNSGAQEAVVKKVHLLDGFLDLGVDPGQLNTVSTAGLRPVAGHPAGYGFLTIGDPKTRQGVVCGWLTSFRGVGIVRCRLTNGAAVLQAHIDYGDLRLPAQSGTASETLLLGRFEDVRSGLEQYADAIARRLDIHLPPKQTVYCTWYHTGASSEKEMARFSEFAAKQLAPFGFTTMQIDDGWQAGLSTNGPKRIFTMANPQGPYPSGMKPTADLVRSLGMVAGLWFMPFAGTSYDPFFKDKQDWFCKNPHGQPYEATWGGTSLDLTHPDARAYLAGLVRRISREWGYKYFKLDGLWTGTATRLQYVNAEYQDDDLGVPTRHDPSLTPIEAYRLGLRLVRQEAGRGVFLLGCSQTQNMRSFTPSLGLVDAMRVGPDNGANPGGLVSGPQFSSRLFFLNGRVWYNDPDPVYVRASFPEPMARTSVSWTALSGSLHSSSDNYLELPPARLDMLKRSMPSHDLQTARPVDYLEQDVPRVWLLTDDRRRERHDVVGLFNWDFQKNVRVEYPVDRIGLPKAKAYVGFDYWGNQFVPPFQGMVSADLPPGGCCVLALRPVADRPLLVGTSRHVTQGAVDLLEEEWTGSELRGRSQVVAGDPYELRVVVPVGQDSWQLAEARAGGLKGGIRENGPAIRVRWEPSETGVLGWELKFKRGPVVAGEVAPIKGLTAKAGQWHEGVRLAWEPEENALAFRIIRQAGGEVTVLAAVGNSCLDNQVKSGQAYAYAVQGRNWTGEWSAPATATVQIPSQPKRPDDPPLPAIRCGQLQPVAASVGYGRMNVDKTVIGKPLTLDGKRYEFGLGVHAASQVIYTIPQGARSFVAVVGIDDEVKDDPRASVMFQILGDVKEMGEKPIVIAQSPRLDNQHLRTWAFQVELDPRFREIQLIVTDAGDGINCDHGDWANAGFLAPE